MQIGNETFYSSSEECKEDTIESLADLWTKACRVCFNDDEGKHCIQDYQRMRKMMDNQLLSLHLVHGYYGMRMIGRDNYLKEI